jgi:hypothetical protein
MVYWQLAASFRDKSNQISNPIQKEQIAYCRPFSEKLEGGFCNVSLAKRQDRVNPVDEGSLI